MLLGERVPREAIHGHAHAPIAHAIQLAGVSTRCCPGRDLSSTRRGSTMAVPEHITVWSAAAASAPAWASARVGRQQATPATYHNHATQQCRTANAEQPRSQLKADG